MSVFVSLRLLSLRPTSPQSVAEQGALIMLQVREEITQQVIRLNWHPSIMIWGGNNEAEGAMEWYEPT
jgi:hypothetical protein